MNRRNIIIGGVVAVLVLGAIGAAAGGSDAPAATTAPVAQAPTATPVPATLAPATPVPATPVPATPVPATLAPATLDPATLDPATSDAPPARVAVKFTGKGGAKTKPQSIDGGDYDVTFVGKTCDGNVIADLNPVGGDLFSGESLINEIAHKATYTFTTSIYGLDPGRYYVDAQINNCRTWTITLKPAE
jgi:hypothetical protein